MKRQHMTHNTNTLGADCAPAAPNVTGYYFAARYSRHAELAMYRNQLLAGLPNAVVTSRWIDCHDGELEQSYTPERLNADPAGCWRHGADDIEDLCDADVLVNFTGNGGGGKGGRYVEYGYWLAAVDVIQQLRPYAPHPRICVVGPRENIFHCHPATEIYPDWTAFLTHELRRHQ